MRSTNTERGSDFRLMVPPPSWRNPNGSWTGAYARQIVVDRYHYQHAYVLEENTGRIWETTNAGTTAAGWTELTDNLGSHRVYCLDVYNPTPNSQPGESILFAGTQTGV